MEGIGRALFNAIQDSTKPENRVFRKVVGITVSLIIVLVIYRHYVLGFGSFESIAVTGGLGFIILVTVGIIGGSLVATLYTSFLGDVGATNNDLSLTVFIVEWCVALSAPIVGIVASLVLSNHSVLQ